MNQVRHRRSELVTEIIIPQSPKVRKNQSQLSQNKQIEEQYIQIPKAAVASEVDNQVLLQEELRKSQKLTSFAERQIIQQHRTQVERKVHSLQSGMSQEQILNNLYQMSIGDNPHLQQEIQKLIQKAENKAINELAAKNQIKRQIPLTKDDLRELQKVDKYRLLKIKNGEIKNKIGNLREQLEHQYYERKANFKLPQHENVKMSDYYSLDHPKTQEANMFVNKLQDQKREDQMRFRQYYERKQQQKEMMKSMELEQKMLQREEKKRRMQQLYEQKKLKKQMQKEQNERKKEEIKHWSSVFNRERPLYIRKQEQYIENELIPEIYSRRQKLFEIKMQRRQLNMNEINEHDERYMEYKKDNNIRHEAEIQIEKQKQKKYHREISQYYKGQYRLFALEQMINEKLMSDQNPREIERIKKARQIMYADAASSRIRQQIKKKQNKTLELTPKKQLVKRVRKIDGSLSTQKDQVKASSFTDARQEGLKNFNFLKQLVKEKGIKKQKPMIKIIQERHAYPNYLHEIKQKRRNSLQLDSGAVLNQPAQEARSPKNVNQQKMMSDKARRSNQKRRYMSLDSKEDASLEQSQLQAIKHKLKMIQELK